MNSMPCTVLMRPNKQLRVVLCPGSSPVAWTLAGPPDYTKEEVSVPSVKNQKILNVEVHWVEQRAGLECKGLVWNQPFAQLEGLVKHRLKQRWGNHKRRDCLWALASFDGISSLGPVL